jgi:hypothetical protein
MTGGAAGEVAFAHAPLGLVHAAVAPPRAGDTGEAEVLAEGEPLATVELFVDETIGFPVEIPGSGYWIFADGSAGTSPEYGCSPFCGTWSSVDGTWFPVDPQANRGALQQGGREVVTGPYAVAGLSALRRTYVPASGAFVRFLDVLSNPAGSGADISVRWLLTGEAWSETGGRDWSIVATSSAPGDTTFDATDDYVVAAAPDTPVVAYVPSGPNGRERHAEVEPYFDSVPEGGYFAWDTIWPSVTLAPGQTVMVMQFALTAPAGESALAEARAQDILGKVAQGDSEVLAGISAAERAQIINFEVP